MNFSYLACHAPVINNQLLHVDSRNMDLTGGTPDCKVWHFRRDLVGAGPTWLVRIWCGFCGSGADLERCGADLERYGAEMARAGHYTERHLAF